MKNKRVFYSFQTVFFCLILFFSSCERKPLVILFSNDTHSQVDVCGENMKENSGLGGYAYRAAFIDSIRHSSSSVLLFDAGDFSQGSPFFNLYKGRIEIAAYNQMRYDAVTLGNHEFDNGLDTLAERLHEAKFKVICSNYDVERTPLENLVEKFAVFERGGWKIGVIGLGVNPEGLILKSNFGTICYQNPIERANYYADFLKKEHHCNLVIVLSHLGSEYANSQIPSDVQLAQQSKNIDIILGGHTHKQLRKFELNLEGKEVCLMQTGKAGGFIGKIEIDE